MIEKPKTHEFVVPDHETGLPCMGEDSCHLLIFYDRGPSDPPGERLCGLPASDPVHVQERAQPRRPSDDTCEHGYLVCSICAPAPSAGGEERCGRLASTGDPCDKPRGHEHCSGAGMVWPGPPAPPDEKGEQRIGRRTREDWQRLWSGYFWHGCTFGEFQELLAAAFAATPPAEQEER